MTTHVPAMVISDLDGTLLDADGVVSPRNAEMLHRAADAGAKVVIATGRPVYNLRPVLDAGFTGIAVCMNGAVVYDIAAGEALSVTLLDPSVMQDVVSDLDQTDLDFHVAAQRGGAEPTAGNFWAETDYEHPWWSDYETHRAPRRSVLSSGAVKMYFRYAPDQRHVDGRDVLSFVREVAADRVSVTESGGLGLLETAAAGVNKASALAKLAANWGVDSRDAIVFGDMPNDIEMFQWAGQSVAMANAHPDVAAVASEIGGHHDRSAVANVLQRWF